MKRTVFNGVTKKLDLVERERENTNEEILKENENTKISRKFKLWLETNKIFFEVFSYVFVGVMGIVISLVGLKFNVTTVDIYQRQLQIEENDSEPRFSSELLEINEKNTEYAYEIVNDGGIASGCTVCPIPVGVYFINNKFVRVSCIDNFSAGKLESGEKCIIAFSRSKKLFENIEKELENQCIMVLEYVALDYINYQNKNISNYYCLTSKGMYLIDKEQVINSDAVCVTYDDNTDIKEIANLIREKSEDKNLDGI